MLVSDIMTLDPNCCAPECTAQEAARRMHALSLGALLVIDGAGKLVGIVTDRDLCMGVLPEACAAQEVTIAACMTTAVASCAAGEPVERALAIMREHRVRRLPVIDSVGRALGIISLSDIVRYAALPEAEVVAAVARICEPRSSSRRRKESAESTASR
jgi:CBS domain-containing protein